MDKLTPSTTTTTATNQRHPCFTFCKLYLKLAKKNKKKYLLTLIPTNTSPHSIQPFPSLNISSQIKKYSLQNQTPPANQWSSSLYIKICPPYKKFACSFLLFLKYQEICIYYSKSVSGEAILFQIQKLLVYSFFISKKIKPLKTYRSLTFIVA